jgi:hypothetical protein
VSKPEGSQEIEFKGDKTSKAYREKVRWVGAAEAIATIFNVHPFIFSEQFERVTMVAPESRKPMISAWTGKQIPDKIMIYRARPPELSALTIEEMTRFFKWQKAPE